MKLFKSIRNQMLNFEEMCTLTTEFEVILNSQPIILLDSTPFEREETLTPGHSWQEDPYYHYQKEKHIGTQNIIIKKIEPSSAHENGVLERMEIIFDYDK